MLRVRNRAAKQPANDPPADRTWRPAVAMEQRHLTLCPSCQSRVGTGKVRRTWGGEPAANPARPMSHPPRQRFIPGGRNSNRRGALGTATARPQQRPVECRSERKTADGQERRSPGRVAAPPGSLARRRTRCESSWLWFLRQSQTDSQRVSAAIKSAADAVSVENR